MGPPVEGCGNVRDCEDDGRPRRGHDYAGGRRVSRSAMADDQNQALYDQWVRPRYVDKKWYYAQIQSLGRTDMSSCDNPFTVCWRSHDKLYPH